MFVLHMHFGDKLKGKKSLSDFFSDHKPTGLDWGEDLDRNVSSYDNIDQSEQLICKGTHKTKVYQENQHNQVTCLSHNSSPYCIV